jgi:hypothetical protein
MTMKNEALRSAITAAVIALGCVAIARAHHSTAAEFDQNKPVTFTGTVQKVMWMNPHIYTHIEVKQQGAEPLVYHVEGGPPNSLFRQGWRKDSLKAGDTVTVTGWRAKNADSHNVGQATITTADGRKIFTGDGPAKAAN